MAEKKTRRNGGIGGGLGPLDGLGPLLGVGPLGVGPLLGVGLGGTN